MGERVWTIYVCEVCGEYADEDHNHFDRPYWDKRKTDVVPRTALEAANQARDEAKREADFWAGEYKRDVRECREKLDEAEKEGRDEHIRRHHAELKAFRFDSECDDLAKRLEAAEALLTKYERAIRGLLEAAQEAWPSTVQAGPAKRLRAATKSARSLLPPVRAQDTERGNK